MVNIIKLNFIVFGIIGLIHLIRLVTQFDAVIGGYSVPLLLNLLFFVLAGWLAFENYKIYNGRKK
mgnify:CR=1 FL=1